MTQKSVTKDDVTKARKHLKAKETALKKEIAKERNGRDLVFLFYSLMSIVIGMATIQIIAYHIGTYYDESVFYKAFNDIFTFLGFDTGSPTFAHQFFGLPLNILIDAASLYTLGYGGFEGSTAFIKSLSLDSGQFVQMPEKKIKRFFRFVIVWYITAILLSIYQMILLPTDTQISFFIDKVYVGLGTSTVVYMYGRKAPKTVADVTIKKATVTGSSLPQASSPIEVAPTAPIQERTSQVVSTLPKNPTAELSPGGN